MGRVEALLEKYRETISTPWSAGIADAQRVIFLVYEPVDELKLRLKLPEFELVTRQANHGWHAHDITDAFPAWLSAHEYREQYFSEPEDLLRDQKGDITDFHTVLVKIVREEAQRQSSPSSVFAVYGVGSLFGFSHVSGLVDETKAFVKGRYVVFFPGDYHQNNYRLLDARDGWNYLAMPITANE